MEHLSQTTYFGKNFHYFTSANKTHLLLTLPDRESFIDDRATAVDRQVHRDRERERAKEGFLIMCDKFL